MMTNEHKARLRREGAELKAKAAEYGIELEWSDFKITEGELTLDQMPAAEWVDAMTRD